MTAQCSVQEACSWTVDQKTKKKEAIGLIEGVPVKNYVPAYTSTLFFVRPIILLQEFLR